MKKKILAVELPAQCDKKCSFCRTPEHGLGDSDAVLKQTQDILSSDSDFTELYITSNGEPYKSPIFKKMIDTGNEKGISVAVLCADEASIVKGITRAEISVNKYTIPEAEKAIKKAKNFGIPVFISMVDTGKNIDHRTLEHIVDNYNVDGILIRALQPEGLSKKSVGKTSWFNRSKEIKQFPVAAYKELQHFEQLMNVVCINPFGKMVSVLGGN